MSTGTARFLDTAMTVATVQHDNTEEAMGARLLCPVEIEEEAIDASSGWARDGGVTLMRSVLVNHMSRLDGGRSLIK